MTPRSLFANSKCKRYCLKPATLTWTAMYRKQHKKDIHAEFVKKKRCRTTKKPYSRSIVGTTLEVIQKKRTEKVEVHGAARGSALRYTPSGGARGGGGGQGWASAPSLFGPALSLAGARQCLRQSSSALSCFRWSLSMSPSKFVGTSMPPSELASALVEARRPGI